MHRPMDDPRVEDLLRRANLPLHAEESSDRVEFRFTHGSFVFLTERSVFKLKRPRDLGFLDYTTLEARKHYCEEELRLNRRATSGVYLAVLPVYCDADGYSLTRGGEIVDYAVHMRRLADADSAVERLRAGTLGSAEIEAIAARVVAFYESAEPVEVHPDTLAESVEENFAQTESMVGSLFDRDRWTRVVARQREQLVGRAARLAERHGRDGHGDLRLEHVYLLEGGVQLIDCIEFNERFRAADPALDAAFLAMDLRREGQPTLAEAFLARFAEAADDFAFYPLADLYTSYRAMVRAKVAGFVAVDDAASGDVRERKRGEARAFLELAEACLGERSAAVRLIAVGGMIAAGKSTVAQRLGRELAVPVVNADRVRRRLAAMEGVGAEERYEPEFDGRVQAAVLERARDVLESGRSVLVDTTLRTHERRAAVCDVAAAAGAGFVAIECRAPERELRERLRAREHGEADASGASDAREDLLERFLASYEPFDELGDRRIVWDGSAGGDAERRWAALRAALDESSPDAHAGRGIVGR